MSDRALGAGVAGFVVVHLLAVLAFEDPSLPVLAGIEALAVGALLAGDAVAAGIREALPSAGGAVVALVAVGAVLGPPGVATWAVAVGTLVVAAVLLYAGHWYDGLVAWGELA